MSADPAAPAGDAKPTLARRALRASRNIFLGTVFLVGIGYVWLIDAQDMTPLLGSQAATETARLLSAAAAETRARPIERGSLQVGWSKASITPPLGTATYGSGGRLGKGITEVKDDVWAHAVAIRVGDGPPLVFITADICLWVSDVSASIAERVADLAPRERIYFGATHTHTGPGGYADGPAAALIMGERRAEDVERLVAGAAQAIRAAIGDLSPGGLREISAPAPEFIRNRMRPGEPLDDELLLVEYRKEDGRRCVLVNYSAHATTISTRYLICSSEYPGALCRTLLKSGYDEALFFAAETGQAGPRVPEGPAKYSPDIDDTWRMGEAVAERVLALSRASQGPYQELTSLAVFRSPVKVSGYRWPRFGGMVDPDIAAYLVGYDEPIIFVHGLRLGTTVYVGHSFEFSSVIGKRLKARAREKGHRLMLTSFNGDHNLYVIPESYWGRGYEAGMTLYGPSLGPYMERITEQVDDALSALEAPAAPSFDLSR